jgi:hypothetical protein
VTDGRRATEPAETVAEPTIDDRTERLVRDSVAAVWNDGDLAALDGRCETTDS